MALFKIVNGENKKITSREQKATIKKAFGWSSRKYQKQYYLFRNRLRHYEAFERSQGKSVVSQSVSEFLYKQAKAKIAYGSQYKPSLELKRIKKFSAISSGKALQKSLMSQIQISKSSKIYQQTTLSRFKGLIAVNKQAQEIYQKIKNPIQRERALSDLANELHAKQDEQRRLIAESAIPFGDVIGSGDSIEFDISQYI